MAQPSDEQLDGIFTHGPARNRVSKQALLGILTAIRDSVADGSIELDGKAQTISSALENRLPHVATVSALRAKDTDFAPKHLWLDEYSPKSKSGGGILLLDPDDQASFDNGGTIFVTAGGRRYKRQSGGPTSVKGYGAVGDGQADDTSALQACHDAEIHIHYDIGIYRITGPITLRNNGQRITGASMIHSTIQQSTDNTPIFLIRNEYYHSNVFENLRFAWSSPQALQSESAAAFRFGQGAERVIAFQCTFRHLRFADGLRGFDIDPAALSTSCYWGCSFNGLWFEPTWRGTTIRHAPTIPAGAPNNNFDNIYVRADSIFKQEPVLLLSGCRQTRIGVFEVNKRVNGGQIARILSSEISWDVFSEEQGEYNFRDIDQDALFSYADSTILVRFAMSQLSVFRPTRGDGGDNVFIFKRHGGASGRLVVDNINIEAPTIGSGNLYAVGISAGSADNNEISIGRVSLGGTSRFSPADQLKMIGRHGLAQFRKLPLLSAPPDDPPSGAQAFADGVTWNPGRGSGLYFYDEGKWHFLGGAQL